MLEHKVNVSIVVRLPKRFGCVRIKASTHGQAAFKTTRRC